jgi:hypothetical protein
VLLLQGLFEHPEEDGSNIVDKEPCTCANWLLRLGLEQLRTIQYIIANEPAGVRDASKVIVRLWVHVRLGDEGPASPSFLF